MLDNPVLILNSGMIPVDISNVKNAIILQVLNKAISIKEVPDKFIRSQKLSFRLPRVISLLRYNKIPKKRVVLSRLNIIYRDDMRCSYCGKRFPINQLTVDHIIPYSRWDDIPSNIKSSSVNSWENQVTACQECNYRKGNRLLHECGLKLLVKPFEPKYMPYLVISKNAAQKYGWMEFLTYNVKIVEFIR